MSVIRSVGRARALAISCAVIVAAGLSVGGAVATSSAPPAASAAGHPSSPPHASCAAEPAVDSSLVHRVAELLGVPVHEVTSRRQQGASLAEIAGPKAEAVRKAAVAHFETTIENAAGSDQHLADEVATRVALYAGEAGAALTARHDGSDGSHDGSQPCPGHDANHQADPGHTVGDHGPAAGAKP